MSNPARPQRATNDRDDVVRRDARRFVDEQQAARLSRRRRHPRRPLGARGLGVFDLSKQILDARRASDALIGSEGDLRCQAQAKRASDSRTKVECDARESLVCRRPFRIGAHHADEYFGMTEVARYLDTGDSHHPRDARILHVLGEERSDFFADAGRHAVSAAIVRRHRALRPKPSTRAYARPTRCGNTR